MIKVGFKDAVIAAAGSLHRNDANYNSITKRGDKITLIGYRQLHLSIYLICLNQQNNALTE